MNPNMLDVALFGPVLVQDWDPITQLHSGNIYCMVIVLGFVGAETKSASLCSGRFSVAWEVTARAGDCQGGQWRQVLGSGHPRQKERFEQAPGGMKSIWSLCQIGMSWAATANNSK